MTYVEKKPENDKVPENKFVEHEHGSGTTVFQYKDRRTETGAAQKKLNQQAKKSPYTTRISQLQTRANQYSVRQQPSLQKKENRTGLPDKLKAGIEKLSAYSLDDVNVHYNSDKPAQLQAHAYAQGTDIYMAPGQEKHLPHEAWHVVQQKQGRVKPTKQIKGKIHVNDDKGLEKEADVMGAKAIQMHRSGSIANTEIPLKKAVNLSRMSDASVQCLRISGREPGLQNLREQLAPYFSDSMLILDKVLPVFMNVQHKNYPSEKALAHELKAVVGLYRDLTRTSSLPTFIARQRSGQDEFRDFSDQGWYRKLFTTVGFEHEFADMHNSFLAGVSHMEIARSQETMPLTGIHFILETDASNALELVSPPFLLPTTSGASIPDPSYVKAVDDLMRRMLKDTTPPVPQPTQQQQLFGNVPPPPTVTMNAILQQLDQITGLNFNYTNLRINPEHLSHRADVATIAPHLQDPGNGPDPQLRLHQNDVRNIDVRRSHKARNERHNVSAQVNFATDLKTASTLMGASTVNGAAIYRSLETQLANGLGINGIQNPSVKRFGKYMVKNLVSLFSVHSQDHLRTHQQGFYARLQQEASHVHGHGGGPAGPGLDDQQQREFRLHAKLSSFVKDSTQIWIKDHLVSQAEGILKNQNDRKEGAMLALDARKFAGNWNAPASITNLNDHSDPAAHWTDFIRLLRRTAARVWDHLNNHTGSDNAPGVGLYEHDPKFSGARQDTMLDPAGVQQPDLFDNRLHVAEVRRGDPSEQIADAVGRL